MRDLELRGAGNLLGDEQSGHVAAVGFELYCELLAEAVAELQGQPRRARCARVRLDAALDAYVPADYVGLEGAKMDVHRRIALSSTVDELRDVEVELADRFGPLPEPVENLVLVQEARIKLAPLGADARGRARARDDRRVALGPSSCGRCARPLPRARQRRGGRDRPAARSDRPLAQVIALTERWATSGRCYHRGFSLGEGAVPSIAARVACDAAVGGLRYCYR